MNKLFIVGIFLVSLLACKNEKKQEPEAAPGKEGIYEAIFIDVNNTEIPADMDPKAHRETRLLSNINLASDEKFWGEKRNFYMHAMGSLDIKEGGTYHFRLTSNGKIMFRLNHQELVKAAESDVTRTNVGSMFLDQGATVFEFEYFPGNMDPYLVFEWSKDGTNFEVVPDKMFNNLDALTVRPWEGEEEASGEEQADNSLTEEEVKEGWKLLFDGKTTNGWHTYLKPGTIGKKWYAKDGALVFEGRQRFEFFVAGRKVEIGPMDKVADGGEDIVSDEAFENFELNLEWKISKGGNNGLFYMVKELDQYNEVWKTSPEMQVMDNMGHKDGLIYKHRAGDLYDLIAADPIRVKPFGTWNKVRIIKNNGKVEHWLNGTKVVSYDINSPEWTDMISRSKFADLPDFATPGPGKIAFQDHDNEVHYKNIKIKVLD